MFLAIVKNTMSHDDVIFLFFTSIEIMKFYFLV